MGAEIIRLYVIDCWLSPRASRPFPLLSHLLNASHGVRQHVLEYSVDAALAGEHAWPGWVIGVVLHMYGVTYVETRTCGVIDTGSSWTGVVTCTGDPSMLCMGPGETRCATGIYRGRW